MSDGYDELDPGDDGYGPSPATRVRGELYVRPALTAVAVEVVVVIFFGNQWMLDHVVVPWNGSDSIVQRSVSDALGAVSWTLTPHGFAWFWLGSIARALVWFALTYLLVQRVADVRDALGRFVAVVGAVFLAQLGGLLADRVVSYGDVSQYYRSVSPMTEKPGFGEWLLTGAVGTGGVLAFTLVAAVVAVVFGTAVSPGGTDERVEVAADDSDHPGE